MCFEQWAKTTAIADIESHVKNLPNSLLEKRKLGPIVGTTSIGASETENQIKTPQILHEQK